MKESICNISNLQELISYLERENNSYSNFIISKIKRDPNSLNGEITQIHHIIPKHQGGPHVSWNLVKLTIEEHATAHQLLFENYQNLADQGASQMISGQIKQGRNTIRQIARETNRRNKTGFFNSELQAELARRPKKQRARYARNRFVLAALIRGFDLVCCSSGDIIKIGPNECTNLVAVIEKLMQHPSMVNERQSWDLTKKKEKHAILTSLTRSLTGHVDKKTGKCVFSFKNWRILGINIYLSID